LKKAPLLNPENLIAETHTRFGVFLRRKKYCRIFTKQMRQQVLFLLGDYSVCTVDDVIVIPEMGIPIEFFLNAVPLLHCAVEMN
jgi:hypothetical protein